MSGECKGIGFLGGKACVVLLVTGMLNLCSCDPVRTTSQGITIAVEDGQGCPVPDAKISIKESWKSWQSWEPGGVKDVDRAFYRAQWESEPWLDGLTNTQGKAVLRFEATALDWTKGDEPPAKRDWVTNREYLFKVQTKDADEELFAVMKAGTVSQGKRFTMRIEAIEKSRYVP